MFADKIQDMQDDEQYVEILHELSKYKTLSHSDLTIFRSIINKSLIKLNNIFWKFRK